jgi:hypothetical protein
MGSLTKNRQMSKVDFLPAAMPFPASCESLIQFAPEMLISTNGHPRSRTTNLPESPVNFNPQLAANTAIFASLFAAFLWGTWFISLKYLGDYPVDGFYVTLFATSLIFVWSVGLLLDRGALFENIGRVFSEDPSRIYVTILCGVLYVTGIRLSLTVMQWIGLSLSQPIQSSINVLGGTFLSALVGGVPEGVSPVWITLACLLLLGAVIVSLQAGRIRSEAAQSIQTLRLSPGNMRRALLLAAGAALFIQAYTLGLSYGLKSITQPNGLAVLPFMSLLASGAFAGALLTSGIILTRQRLWTRVLRAPFSIHKFGMLSALAHYGGNIIHTQATVFLSSVISWPLGLTSGLWTQFWGLAYGEFRGASHKAYALLFAGIVLYLAGAALIAAQVN